MQKKKFKQKLIAILLIFTLTFANFALVSKSYAASFAETFFGSNSDTGHKNIEFEAFFMLAKNESDAEETLEENQNEKTKEIFSDVNEKDLAIKLNLNVLESGYLKNGKIELLEGEENKGLNFEIGKNQIKENSQTKTEVKAETEITEEDEKPDSNENNSNNSITDDNLEKSNEVIDLNDLSDDEINNQKNKPEKELPDEEAKENNELENDGSIQIVLDDENNDIVQNNNNINNNSIVVELDENEIEKTNESKINIDEDTKEMTEESEENIISDTVSLDNENKEANDLEENIDNNIIDENIENEIIDEHKDEEVEEDQENNYEEEITFPEYVEKLEDNVLILSQINSTSNVNIDLPIKYKNEAYTSKDIISGKCKIRFSGIYVDGEGKEHDVEKEEELIVNWTDEREVFVETGTTKYIDFGDGVILQTIVRTNNFEEGNRLPTLKSEIEIEVPSLSDTKPSNVLVVANSLEGTNGENTGTLQFDENNWYYNSDENKLQISVDNKEKLVKQSDYTDEIYLGEEEPEEERLFNGNGTDEYLVTFTYPGISIEDAEKSMVSNIKAKLVSVCGTESLNENNYQYDLSNSQGNIVSLNLENETKEVSKAYFYINYNKEGKYEIELLNDAVINVSYKDIIKNLKLEDISNSYLDKEGNEILTEDTYYKRIEISKENFDKMLGEAGEIKVKDYDGNEVGIINKDSFINERGNLELPIEGNHSKLNYEITKPIAEGNIIIKGVKAISNLSIDKQKLINISKISSKTKLKADYDYVEETVEVEEKTLETELKDTSSKASIKLDRESLSTLSLNENVELRIELNNSSESSDIYGHSVFEVELPEYIESLEITNTQILYGEGLNITDIIPDGRIIRITIDGTQEGINSGLYTNGTNIVINANIKVNLYTPAKKEYVKLRYVNDEATNYENNGEDTFEVTYSAPTGLVAVNSIKGYNGESKVQSVRQGKVVDFIDIYSERKEAEAELIVMNNNGNEISDIKILGRFPFKGVQDILTGDSLGTTLDVKLLSKIDGDERNRGNFRVYYSENGDATNDLENAENNWTEEIESLDNIKSFLIIPEEDYIMEDTEVLRFTYGFEIPENLNHNENIFGTFMAEYKNNAELVISDERQVADLVGLTTGEGPEIEVEVVPDKKEVREYDNLIYTIKITNIGDQRVQDIVGEFPIPNGTNYISFESNYEDTEVILEEREETVNIGQNQNIEVNEIVDFEGQSQNQLYTVRFLSIKSPLVEKDKPLEIKLKFEVSRVDMFKIEIDESELDPNLSEEEIEKQLNEKTKIIELEEFPEKYIEAKGNITAKDLGKTLEFETEKVKVVQACVKIDQTIIDYEDVYPVGDEIEFRIGLNNLNKNNIKNLVITQKLPEELEYIKSSISKYVKVDDRYQYVESDLGNINNENEIVWNLDELIGKNQVSNVDESSITKVYFNYTVKVKDLTDGLTKREISLVAKASSEEIGEYETESLNIEIGKPVLVITQTTNNNNTYIKPGEIVNYTFLIKNEGGAKAENIVLTDKVPEGMIANKISLIDSLGNVQESNPTSEDATVCTYELKPGEEITANVELKASYLNTAETSVTNYGVLSQKNNESITTNSITHIIEANPEDEISEEEGTSRKLSLTEEDNIVQTYKIEGRVWEDKNRNGMRDQDEANLNNISVKLINSNSGIVEKNTNTDSNGKYTFSGISTGNYSVIFEYDTTKYVVTAYQKQGVSPNVNSDAISTRLEQNGKLSYGAITDVISITNSSMSNIDLGLMLTDKFDLKIDKTITKITVQTSKGTTTENYNNVKLAKTEIASKNVTGSVVYVEYEITVSNVGDISGYAKKIVDYIPEGMKFNSSLDSNSKWYTGQDGYLYSKAFEDIELKKGDSKTIKLVLTKNMTSENTGISNNKAEIAEDYNIYGISDTNSSPGNKVQNENDISSADSVILIKTGETFIYISVILTTILLVGIVTFIVYFKVDEMKRKVGV